VLDMLLQLLIRKPELAVNAGGWILSIFALRMLGSELRSMRRSLDALTAVVVGSYRQDGGVPPVTAAGHAPRALNHSVRV
jgi:hypothetical protein